MNEKDLIRLDQVSQFLDGTQAVAFTVLSDKDDRYQWIQRTRFHYLAEDRVVLFWKVFKARWGN